MGSKEHMEIGVKIAEKHKRDVLQLVHEFQATPEKAIEGCIVSLAAAIMVALDERLH